MNFLDVFSKNSQISNLTKIVQWEPSFSMRMDGRTDGERDTTKLAVAFRNSANVSNKTDVWCYFLPS
jgi:hypothetical protein